jgi:hypothetical protein
MYLDRIVPRPICSFVLHPNQEPAWSYLGEQPVASRFAGVLAPPYTGPSDKLGQGHHFGSVPFHPSENSSGAISQLMWLLLGYHCGFTSTCWECGQSGAYCGKVKTPEGRDGEGDTYKCERCSRFWIDTHCFLQGHRLLNIGPGSFHQVAESRRPYFTVCPLCGAGADWRGVTRGRGRVGAAAPPPAPPPDKPPW